MNKKGFTLVEILAVIVLIVVISLLVFPSILNSIKSSQDEIDEATKLLLINAAKLYVDDNSDNYKEDLHTYCIPVSNLIDLGYLSDTITTNKKDDIKDQIIKLNNSNYEVVKSCIGSSKYLVKFVPNGGSGVEDQYINENLKITKPEDPKLLGADFLGWYIDKDLSTPFDFDEPITKNLTLYAKWKINEYSQNGLILYLDGINNNGSNQHSNTILNWIDLSGKFNDVQISKLGWSDLDYVWNDNNLYLKSGYLKLLGNIFDQTKDFTMEFVFMINSSNSAVSKTLYSVMNNNGGGLIGRTGLKIKGTTVWYFHNYGTALNYGSPNEISVNRISKIVLRLKDKKLDIKVNDNDFETIIEDYPVDITPTSNIYQKFMVYTEGSAEYGDPFVGNIYSIRVYNKALDNEEIESNYNLDKARFNIE